MDLDEWFVNFVAKVAPQNYSKNIINGIQIKNY